MLQQAPDYLGSTMDAAGYAGVSTRTLIRWRSLGLGPAYIKLGRHIRYQKQDLDAWLARHRVQPVREVQC
jgi:predicted DNA-binding transcriptional regulator AlpA